MTKWPTAVSRSAARMTACAVGALVPLALAAQDIDVAALTELDDDDSTVTYQDFTVDQLEDMRLVRDGEVIGEVEAVLADATGEVVALAVERDDVPGDDDDEVVVPIDALEFGGERREIRTTLSDDELAALPTWND